MNATSRRQTVDNPETGDHTSIKRVTSKLARADFFFEQSHGVEVTPPPDSSPERGSEDLPKQGAESFTAPGSA
jgi:hypothetical protein